MASKPKAAEAKAPVLKGQEAEDKVLEYIKRVAAQMNRPFGAVDVAANLKGAVPKTATQKILVALADKGELVQKTYGKTTFFVANQDKLGDVSSEKLADQEKEYKSIEEENKALAADVRALSTGTSITRFVSLHDLTSCRAREAASRTYRRSAGCLPGGGHFRDREG
ncbi:hypothetical protein EVJ58_g5859 [Rhodofomes roseus]|uniref:Homologous-pairing protein 2 winged helix domain-containing protein n=1 Tax=Rhodofomes roseus TaxID=34475 RepID=A0A4Y9Y9X8_9APHY|nr:hypothetical protein EVJ58_g5859 [Rhodofomes roseus]